MLLLAVAGALTLALLGTLAVLLLHQTTTWDGHCEYKVEYGFFHYYRSSVKAVPAEHCTPGFILPGFVATTSLTLGILGGLWLSWRKIFWPNLN